MAKFVILSGKAFVDMIRGVRAHRQRSFLRPKQKVGDSVGLAGMVKSFKENRERIQQRVREAGSDIPKGKIAVPQELYTKLRQEMAARKGNEGRNASLREIDKSFYKARGKPGGSTEPASIGDKGSMTRFGSDAQAGLKMPRSSKRKFPKARQREIDERLMRDAREREKDLSILGRKQSPAREGEYEEAELRGLLEEEPSRSSEYKPKYRKRDG
jgi:hypothetical protein